MKEPFVDAPESWSPVFCDATRAAVLNSIKMLRDEVQKIDNRFWALILLGAVQLLSVVGALGYFILTRVELVSTIQVVKAGIVG